MIAKIRKWGNSLALRIPKSVADDVRVKDGSEVDMRVKGGHLMVGPVRLGRYRLDDLLARIKPNNIHAEVKVDGPLGRELL